jgi:hypothetical protein
MDKNQPNEPKENQKQSLNALARYSGMVFQIGIPIVVFLFIGKWLDAKFPMKFPLFTAVLTIVGVFLGMYLVVRELLKQK